MAETHPQPLDDRALKAAVGRMNEDELRRLNRLIVDRLKLLHQAHSTVALSRHNVGERVGFTDSAGRRKTDLIIRLNQKTASILTDDGQRWNVAPQLLEPISPGDIESRG